MDRSKKQLVAAELLNSASDNYDEELHTAKCTVSKIANSKKCVVSGFILALLGLAMYCCVTLLLSNVDVLLIWSSLAVVGAGFFLWLIGAIRYFNLAIDNGDSDALF